MPGVLRRLGRQDLRRDPPRPAGRVPHYTLREPLGVVGAITPWNFPLLLAVWKIAPALALGNTVVLKPASATPLTALILAELLAEAGLPPGAFNVVPGPGAGSARRWPSIPASTRSPSPARPRRARSIMRAAAGTVKRVSLELGGKSPNIVFADADLDAAAKGAINGIFYGKGEVCAAGSRLLVEELDPRRAHGEARRAREEDGARRSARPEDAARRPRRPRSSARPSRGYVEAGKAEGATLVAGGNARPRSTARATSSRRRSSTA